MWLGICIVKKRKIANYTKFEELSNNALCATVELAFLFFHFIFICQPLIYL